VRLILKVINDMAFFQQIYVVMVATCFSGSIFYCLNNLYKKNDRRLSVALAVCGIAFMFPPNIPRGGNADFMAFSIAIFFAASLLKNRTLMNDAITALFFVLMVYSKIIYLPLGLLFLTFDKKTFFRLAMATAVWAILVFLLFWDIERWHSFTHFMRHQAVVNKIEGESMSAILDFYTWFFRKKQLYTVYILVPMAFSVLLVCKKKCRMTGLVTLVLIVFLIAMTFARQYKAAVYTWPIFTVGIFLLPRVFSQYRKLTVPASVVLAILFTSAAANWYDEFSKKHINRKNMLHFQSEYMEVLKETSPVYLVEYFKRPGYYYSIGRSFWMANYYARFEYTEYIKDHSKRSWGCDSYYYIEREKSSGEIFARPYYWGKRISVLEAIQDTGATLAIETVLVPEFRNAFPQLNLQFYKKSQAYDISFFKVSKN
jgi:hypothetical protein